MSERMIKWLVHHSTDGSRETFVDRLLLPILKEGKIPSPQGHRIPFIPKTAAGETLRLFLQRKGATDQIPLELHAMTLRGKTVRNLSLGRGALIPIDEQDWNEGRSLMGAQVEPHRFSETVSERVYLPRQALNRLGARTYDDHTAVLEIDPSRWEKLNRYYRMGEFAKAFKDLAKKAMGEISDEKARARLGADSPTRRFRREFLKTPQDREFMVKVLDVRSAQDAYDLLKGRFGVEGRVVENAARRVFNNAAEMRRGKSSASGRFYLDNLSSQSDEREIS